jgi:Flp pilus assembly protein TadD
MPAHRDDAEILRAAESLAEQGRFREAEALCDGLLLKDPAGAEALNLKGFCLAGQGRFMDALPCFRKACQSLPEHPVIRFNLAKALDDTDDFEGALREYGETIRLAANRVPPLLGRASVHMRRSDPTRALEDLAEVLGIDPKNAEALVLRGACRLVLREIAGALEDFKRALELDPQQKERVNALLRSAFGGPEPA